MIGGKCAGFRAKIVTISGHLPEITGKCNLSCSHCYASSSPQGTHGAMTIPDWHRVIEEAAVLGCRSIQFIGGEPTTHPGLPQFIQIARSFDMHVEVYTNLVSMKPVLWDVFQACNVHVATSFYTADPEIHEEITQGRNSFSKTTTNIKQVIAAGLSLRAGIVEMRPDQAIEEAEAFLRDLGVRNIRVDHIRPVGRGETYIQITDSRTDPRQALCGQCAKGKACITPSGDVYPCVFSRWLSQGNVLHQSFRDIIFSNQMEATRADLTTFFLQRSSALQGNGAPCMPATEKYLETQDLSHLFTPLCDPDDEECNPEIPPCNPNGLCIPDFEEPCDPIKPCPPMASPCTPDMTCRPDEE